MKTFWIVAGIIVVMLVLFALGFTGANMMGYGRGHGMMGGYAFPGFGMMFPFLCLPTPLIGLLAVVAVVWLIATQLQKSGGSMSSARRETPLDILKTRYAKGEITKEQFEEMKKDIGA